MSHLLQSTDTQKYTKSISDTKHTQVANLQNHIQEILSGSHHTFLQGSYKNTTSISEINDIDIVAVKINTFSTVHSPVRLVNPTPFPWSDIFSEIEQKLRNQKLYSWTITRKDKCITVETTNFKADIVPAVQIHEDIFNDPIAIFSHKAGIERLSYPNTHWENGKKKHANTNQNYKPMVRMFKNWNKNYFPTNEVISSHKIESLVYNCPDADFMEDHFISFILIGSRIIEILGLPDPVLSVCKNEDIKTNWDITKRQVFTNGLEEALQHALTAHGATNTLDAKTHWDKTFKA
ncbi:hypothetical protein IT403_02650 [Candidatus Nomurabacteria bacterium]|nr:hypothetical protein [Candidatus Nomurabacteria bacterium]